MLKKMLLIAVLSLLAFFSYATFFSQNFEKDLFELRKIEENSARGNFLAPATISEIENYKAGINLLKKKYNSIESLKSLFEIKLSLAQIQQNLLEIEENFHTANKAVPDCFSGSKLDTAKKLAEQTVTKIDSVVSLTNSFEKKFQKEALMVSEISGQKFEQTLKGLKNGAKQIQQIIRQYC